MQKSELQRLLGIAADTARYLDGTLTDGSRVRAIAENPCGRFSALDNSGRALALTAGRVAYVDFIDNR